MVFLCLLVNCYIFLCRYLRYCTFSQQGMEERIQFAKTHKVSVPFET